ncbi:MAG TPA: flavin monoamine oxidase family protein [Anaerolineales bacterium]|nr:flavin monoamine oxidase family protein [Anaerolineales bacterium]
MPSLSQQDYLALIYHGLPPTRHPKKVILVGAGMAGLVAADLLLKAGHEPIILEAQHRIGGRIFTVREPFAPGLYGEAGAMRLPQSHTLTMAYVEKFGLKTYPFTLENPQAYCHLRGIKHRRAEADTNLDVFGYEFAPHERGKSPGQLWEATLRPIIQKLEREGETAWEEIYAEYDQYSVREFLEDVNRWSEGAIEVFGLLFNQEAMMNSSFLELLREEVGGFYTNLVQIEGGTEQLPLAFLPTLKNHIRFGAKMIAMDQSPNDVTIHYRTLGGNMQVSGDYAILTVPFPVLRHVEVFKPFTFAKQRAIRQLHYDASAKIFLQFRRRFWEEDDGIYGGGTVTDLAVRNIFYPEHGRETGRGVMLASYTWAEDAQRWGSLSERDRIEQALENILQIHPQAREEFEVGSSKMWHDDEFAGGAFALFDPGQQTLLHDHIIAPEGRIHFAGEHASLAHAWIQGAIESGLRAANEIHHTP